MLHSWPVDEEKKKNKVWESPQQLSSHLFRALVADLITGLDNWKLLQDCVNLYNGKGGGQLQPWLSKCRPRHATNPRDKLYGILGLLEDLNERTLTKDFVYEELIIDYSADLQDVYSSIVRSIVTATKRLFILGAYRGRSELVTRSWTPDWTQEFDGFLIRKYRFKEGRLVTEYNAAGDEDAQVVFADDLSSMTVRGFIFDDVVFVSRRLFNLNYQSSALVCEARLRSLYECAEATCTADAITDLKWKVWHNLAVASSFSFEDEDEEKKVQKWFLEMFERWDEIRLSGVKVEKDAEHGAFCDNVTCDKVRSSCTFAFLLPMIS
jgi:hypothetical protein